MNQLYQYLQPHWVIYVSLFVFSLVYAWLLQWWSRTWPEAFDDNTWLAVVIGVGYVLLHLTAILSLDAWLQVAAAFFVACLPIITRSLYNAARLRRETNDWLDKRNGTKPR